MVDGAEATELQAGNVGAVGDNAVMVAAGDDEVERELGRSRNSTGEGREARTVLRLPDLRHAQRCGGSIPPSST
ncbi:unnamed protein product [Urochloa humidicola]